ncbi:MULTISPECIES: SCP2 sterol-binding domain-containing protein [Sulfurihydrogenibium]|jgi:putative sterol carrier protein|uniref:SCP-2 sterol transfer family protein n=1 Tax=Sulfurihydrogenibium yellowstonense SS-5 TaxID=432331 RepID=C4FI60_9AQUI|nr:MULTISPECIES: SCP2 sterol-binding domain-containing protein [Sulfurihydrogenibium]EEP61247.1 SCP-2 sterol transfer family protein [Sulfurihydrogenibium yellowstonense SS-5]
MAKFLSEEWIQLYKDEWNKNDKLVNDLKGFTASIKYFIEGKEDEAVELIVENGVAKSAGKADNKKYDFEMWATYDNWKILAKGEMGPKAAMLTKKLKFKGSMITAMKYMGPFEESLRMMGRVPTEW